MSNQKKFFDDAVPAPVSAEVPPAGFKNCERCAKRCRVVAKASETAQLFVKGDMKTGRYCAECLIVDFFRNYELGPASALGKHYFDSTLPQPEYQKDYGDPDRRFDPESFRLPHIQQQFSAIIAAAKRQYAAELEDGEFDWDEIIANWHLPFPESKKRKGRKKS